MLRSLFPCVISAVLCINAALVPTAFADGLPNAVSKLFDASCTDCHSDGAAEAGVRFDLPKWDLSDESQRHQLERAFQRIADGEMPPSDATPVQASILDSGKKSLQKTLHEFDAARQSRDGRSRLRRMSRTEYEHTVHDLLGITTPLRGMLPPDTVAHGFDKTADALSLSSVLMEKYLEAAETALEATRVTIPKPEITKQRFKFADERSITSNEKLFRIVGDQVYVFSSERTYCPTELRQFKAPTDGVYRVRAEVASVQSEQPVVFSAQGGDLTGKTGEKFIIDYFEAPASGDAIVVEFTVRMRERQTFKLVPLDAGRDIYKDGAATHKGHGLALSWAEVEGPLFDNWPPAGHRSVFGNLPIEATNTDDRAKRKWIKPQYGVVSSSPASDAERIVLDFANRAFRRPVEASEIREILSLTEAKLAAAGDFADAVYLGCKAVLCAPEFLCIGNESPVTEQSHPGNARLNDYALASRLSYFLWSSLPDDELLTLASDGRLSNPAVLRAQTERMLADPKAKRFTNDLLSQWFDLAKIDDSTPDPKLYPEFNNLLKTSMLEETERFIEHLFDEDLSATNLVDSDFTFLNACLADHYGIPNVDGVDLRKVSIPANGERGGILTHASIMKVTANGTNTSPVLRGLWVLENILGTHVPPPPMSVAAVEPDIRGATTIREQFAAHRTEALCASCHDKIDPLGFALERFNAIGGRRDYYRTMAHEFKRADVIVEGRRVPYRMGPSVSTADRFTDGRTFDDVPQFQSIICEDPDRIARCVAEKLLIYSTGTGITFADHATINDIVKNTRANRHGMRSILHAVVQSDAFRSK